MSTPPRHFLDLSELPVKELRTMLDAGAAMKSKLKAQPKRDKPLDGKTLAMIFEKPSDPHPGLVRRRHAPARRHALNMLTGAEMQLGRGETIADTARVLSRYVDAIMIRDPQP